MSPKSALHLYKCSEFPCTSVVDVMLCISVNILKSLLFYLKSQTCMRPSNGLRSVRQVESSIVACLSPASPRAECISPKAHPWRPP